MQDIITRLCGDCPLIGQSVRLQKKFRDTDFESEKLVIHSPRTKSSSNSNLEVGTWENLMSTVMVSGKSNSISAESIRNGRYRCTYHGQVQLGYFGSTPRNQSFPSRCGNLKHTAIGMTESVVGSREHHTDEQSLWGSCTRLPVTPPWRCEVVAATHFVCPNVYNTLLGSRVCNEYGRSHGSQISCTSHFTTISGE